MRYLKLYFTYAKRSLMGKFTYKANVIIGIVAFLLAQTTSLLTLFLLVSAVPSIDGYTIYDIGFLYGVTNMAIGIDHLFSDKLWTVAYNEVRTGKLDCLFLRPVPVLFQVFAHEIQLEAFGEIITAIALMVFCGMEISFNATGLGLILLICGIICASIIITSFKIIVASLAFVFGRSGPLLQVVYNIATYSRYPLSIFPKVIRFMLTFIIPLGICIYLPYENLFTNKYNPFLLLGVMVGATTIFLFLSIIIWNHCCSKYESTGT